jgi:hypothetical protein
MSPAERADLQLRLVQIAYRQRSPAMDEHTLKRLRLRSEAILDAILFVPGDDLAFESRLQELREELRPAS